MKLMTNCLVSQWRIRGGGWQGWSVIIPPPLNLSWSWKPMQSVRDRDRSPPPPWNVDDVTRAMSKGGCLSMSKRGCLSIVRRVDDVTQAMSKGGGACECSSTPPPPPFRKSCIRACIPTGEIICFLSGSNRPTIVYNILIIVSYMYRNIGSFFLYSCKYSMAS